MSRTKHGAELGESVFQNESNELTISTCSGTGVLFVTDNDVVTAADMSKLLALNPCTLLWWAGTLASMRSVELCLGAVWAVHIFRHVSE